MATQRVLSLAIWTFSIPLVVISRCIEGASASFKADLGLCLKCVDELGSVVPAVFIDALVEAEDHRNELHSGVDPIGMLRALIVRVQTGQVQGASTIEQQFVRVVTKRYQRTILRKIREQMLAVAVARRRKKNAIASAYLAIAFYGSGSIGVDGLKARFGPELRRVTDEQALEFVAQLKYPRPQKPKAIWHAKINTRIEALTDRKRGAASKVLQGAFSFASRN